MFRQLFGVMSKSLKLPLSHLNCFSEQVLAIKNYTFLPMENLNFEIRAVIKFLTKLEWKSSAISDSLHSVYGESTPHKNTILRWMKRFKEGRESLDDDERSGRPSTSTNAEKVAAVQKLLDRDCRISVEVIAKELDISQGSAYSILTDHLRLSKLSARWVPKALRDDQLAQRADLSLSLLMKIEADEDDFMDRIITGDETWVHQFDPENKNQSKQWLPKGSAGPIKFKAEKSAQKVMATIFWDSTGVILIDFLEGQKTITGAYYEDVLRKLRTVIREKRPGKLHRGILFHHDNAPAHSSRLARETLREFRWQMIPHPPYNPDLAPSDYFLFPKLKEYLKGKRFQCIEEAKREVKTWCNSRSHEFFREGLVRWKHRLQKCIDLNGNYVEK